MTSGVSILSDTEIIKHIEKKNIIIHPFTRESLSNCSYDITLGKHFYRSQSRKIFNPWNQEHVSQYWGVVQHAEIVTKETEKEIGFPVGTQFIRLLPREMILAHTQEFIGGRNYITTMMKCRSSLGRSGISICRCAGYGDIGYINRWTMEISNATDSTIILPVGFRIGQIVFFYSTVPTKPYSGKYQTLTDSSLETSDGVKNYLNQLITSWKPEMMLPKLYFDVDNDKNLVTFDTPYDKEFHNHSNTPKIMPEQKNMPLNNRAFLNRQMLRMGLPVVPMKSVDTSEKLKAKKQSSDKSLDTSEKSKVKTQSLVKSLETSEKLKVKKQSSIKSLTTPEKSKDPLNETPINEEIPKETPNDTPKEISNDTPKEISNDTPKEISNDTPKEISNDTHAGIPKEETLDERKGKNSTLHKNIEDSESTGDSVSTETEKFAKLIDNPKRHRKGVSNLSYKKHRHCHKCGRSNPNKKSTRSARNLRSSNSVHIKDISRSTKQRRKSVNRYPSESESESDTESQTESQTIVTGVLNEMKKVDNNLPVNLKED
jgi:dCTP deaminase